MPKVGVSIPSMESIWRRGSEAGSCSSSSAPPAPVPQVTGGGGHTIVHGVLCPRCPNPGVAEDDILQYFFCEMKIPPAFLNS